MGYAEILKMKLTDNKKIEGRAAETIYKNSIAAQELTKRLLGFARRGRYNPVSLGLNEVIKDTVNVLEKIFEKNITINYDLDHYVKSVDADENQIIQVLTNLIINAKDAMPEGGEITFQTRNVYIDEANTSLYPEIIKPGHYVRLSISDTGIGMTKEIIDHIFEPFFTTKEKDKGTGLGLATVYGIVKNHNGYVFCQSQPNAGTTFTILLPPGNKELIKEKEKVTNKTGTGKILVVDDEEFVLNLSKDILKRLGYDVILADSGNKAMEIYTKNIHQIDLVLLDIIMPGMDGIETFQTLKKIDPHIKVLFFSGFNKNKKINEILEDGEVGFIEKPFNMKILSDALSKLLDRLQ
jgi:CheY-like chemotaxis protein